MKLHDSKFSAKHEFIELFDFTFGWTLTWMWMLSEKKGGASWQSVPGASLWPPVCGNICVSMIQHKNTCSQISFIISYFLYLFLTLYSHCMLRGLTKQWSTTQGNQKCNVYKILFISYLYTFWQYVQLACESYKKASLWLKNDL